MGNLLVALIPLVTHLLEQIFKPKHQPEPEDEEQFPRPPWLPNGVNVAITGQSGTGKSTLINTLRDVPDDAPNAAKTGVGETTMDANPYKFPQCEFATLYDLPG